LNRLGGIARKYLANLYGLTTSPLHLGLPTDRLWVEWHLDSARVVGAVSDLVTEPEAASFAARIELPRELDQWKHSATAEVARVQARIRQEFSAWFRRGYAAMGVRKSSEGAAYLLAPWSDF
jgi:predicted GNAT superfamily acetyltransferase